MAKSLTLKDLTKAELLELLDKYVFSITDREIVRVRYNSLIRRAGAATADALTNMEIIENSKDMHKNETDAKRKYNEAMKLYSEAQKIKSLETSGPRTIRI